MNRVTPKQAFTVFGIVVVVTLAASFLNRQLASPSSGPPGLASAISGSILGNVSGFTVQNTHYFDGGSWVVASVVPSSGETDPATIIVQKGSDNSYHIRMGPGTSFPANSLLTLPSDVVQYLGEQGLISAPR